MNKLLLLICFLFIGKAYAQVVITGKVVDAQTNEPLIGASIHVKGSTNGTITNVEGVYRIESSADSGVIVASFLGYSSQENSFAGSATINVALESDLVNLGDVLVIGYGQVKEKDLSTAVSPLKNIQEIKSRATGVSSMLQGNIAGVNVVNNGGDPDKEPSIIIRGLGSPGDKPLWVVDGVPGAPFNSQEVESITVLKDAASAAIYGANVGSGGVIIVTTKQAAEGKVSIEANYTRGIQQAWRTPEALNAPQFNDIKNLAADNAGTPRNDAYNASVYPYGNTTRTNWVDEIFRTGSVERFSVIMSGGSDKVKALAAFETTNNQGILLNTQQKTLGGRVNLDFKLSDHVKVSQWVRAKRSQGNSALTAEGYTGAIISAIYMPPSASVYNEDGTFGGVVTEENLDKAGSYGDIVNPVATLMRKDIYNPTTQLHSTTKLTIDFLKDFSFNSQYTISSNQNQTQEFIPSRPEPGKSVLENSKIASTYEEINWLWENTIAYQNQIGKHNINLLGGYSTNYKNNRGFGLQVYNFDSEDPLLRHLNKGQNWSKSQPYENRSEEAFTSLFGRATYVYGGRYFITGSVRKDATSNLYTDNNSGVFPAVSGAWKLSSEPFFNIEKVSLVKLRASWGQIGNVSTVPRYSHQATITTGRGGVLGKDAQRITGGWQETVPDLSLTWETSEQLNIGLDMDFFDHKLSFVGDYFIKTTKDLIQQLQPTPTAGVDVAPYSNVGEVENKGFELALNYNNGDAQFKYNIGANLSMVNSEVKEFGGIELYSNDVTVRGVLSPVYSAIGEPWYSYYLIESDGIFQSDAEAANHVNKDGKRIQPDAVAGDLKFIDKNDDGIINDEDREFMGSSIPTLHYGFNFNCSYKGFDLAMLWQGTGQSKVFNAFKSTTLTASEQGYNMSSDILDAWSPSNTGSDIPRISATDPNKNFQTNSDWFLEDGSYLRLKNLTVGYTLPNNLMNKIKLNGTKLRLYVTGENLLTFTNYSGMDPEVGNHGVDVGNYPVARVMSFGVTLNY